jgi:uncharacterized protein (DUF433 family)
MKGTVMQYPHIIQSPDTCSGLPRIEGTRITVNVIAREVVRLRRTPEEVLMAHPHLTLAQIHAALDYYFDNREQIEASLREAEDVVARLRAQFPSRLGQVAAL